MHLKNQWIKETQVDFYGKDVIKLVQFIKINMYVLNNSLYVINANALLSLEV